MSRVDGPDAIRVASELASGRARHRDGALGEAEQHYLAALAIEPEHGEALELVAVLAFDRRDWPRAEQYARAALTRAPGSSVRLHLLARIRLERGDAAGAVQLLNEALAAGGPTQTDVLLDLAACHAQQKAWPEALSSARGVLAERPTQPLALRLAGFACLSMGRDAEGVEYLERVLAVEPNQPAVLHASSVMLYRTGQALAALQRAQRACELAPANKEYAYSLRLAAAAAVPDWHFNMVHDTARNEAFARAISTLVDPTQLVLEIGAGSGLLAMLAARAGARRVVTCEENPALALAAVANVRSNGLADQVSVVAKPSTQLTVGTDLPELADVLIGEIFSVQVITEGVLPSLEDAKARLLKPGARIIPERAAARGMLVGGERLARQVSVDHVLGLDLSALNAFKPVVQYLHSSEGLTSLSEPQDLLSFDFARDAHFPPEKRQVELIATANGTCRGVLQWLRLDLVPGVHFENAPGDADITDSQHWTPVFYPFPSPVELEAGQRVTLRVSHNRSGMRVEIA